MSGELLLLQAIGVAAGRRFAALGMDDVAADPPHELAALERWRMTGRAWVTTDRDGHPVGFVVVDLVDAAVHVEEVSVLPDVGGRGHGMALMRHVEKWARAKGYTKVTLTTFREVPWNQPWYERRGYRVLAEEEWTPGLVARREREAAQGLDPDQRVIMAKAL